MSSEDHWFPFERVPVHASWLYERPRDDITVSYKRYHTDVVDITLTSTDGTTELIAELTVTGSMMNRLCSRLADYLTVNRQIPFSAAWQVFDGSCTFKQQLDMVTGPDYIRRFTTDIDPTTDRPLSLYDRECQLLVDFNRVTSDAPHADIDYTVPF